MKKRRKKKGAIDFVVIKDAGRTAFAHLTKFQRAAGQTGRECCKTIEMCFGYVNLL